MTIVLHRGSFEVYVYHPAHKRKLYVGRRKKKGDARTLEAEKTLEFKGGKPPSELTIRDYSERWLNLKHGKGTRRPRESTQEQNESALKPFLQEFGDRLLDGGLERREALDWALGHRTHAKAASAMFNDAVDDQLAKGNPLANRRHPQGKGRKDINPVTEAEVDRLYEIALSEWHAYGPVCGAWILWSAWVGSRPGETFKVRWDDLDLGKGLASIKRCKPPYNTDLVVVPRRVVDAIYEMRLPRSGILFPSVTGKPITARNGYGYYFGPVRMAFQAGLTPQRRIELLGDRPNLDLYELRHACASLLADRGCNEFEIAAQLGNSAEVCRATYIHGYKDRVRDRLRAALDASVVDLQAVRERKGA